MVIKYRIHDLNLQRRMDEATLKHLVGRRIEYTKPKHVFDPAYRSRILDMTTQFMDQPGTGALHDAFETYVSECISHFKRQDMKAVEIPVLECDKTLYPKQLKLVKKQNNIRQMYEKIP